MKIVIKILVITDRYQIHKWARVLMQMQMQMLRILMIQEPMPGYEDTSLVKKCTLTEEEYNERKGIDRDWARQQKTKDEI